MQERDKKSFLRFFFIFDSILTFVKDSDFEGLLLRDFLLRKLEKLSFEFTSSEVDWYGDLSNLWMSFSVFEIFNEFAKTSLIKSGWLFASDREDVLCSLKVSCLHALVCGNELGRTPNDLILLLRYVPPDRSSRNSSSSEELMRSSANEDWRESDCGGFKWAQYSSPYNNLSLISLDSFACGAETAYSTKLLVDQNVAIVLARLARDCQCSVATRCSSFQRFSKFLPCSLTQKISSWAVHQLVPSWLTTSSERISFAMNMCQVITPS